MASRDATIQKRINAVERIKRALPGVQFDRAAARGGPEFAHAADLEAVAAYLENNRSAPKGEAAKGKE